VEYALDVAQLTEMQFKNTGCVVSFCPTASAIGKRILIEGGNAVDAAVGVALALTVTYPQAGNIGGGGLMLIHRSTGEDFCLDYRETAPQKIDLTTWMHPESTVFGATAACVPGTVAGLAEALRAHGTWSWDRVVSICVDLAESGVWVSSRQGLAYQIYREELERFPSTRDVFLTNGHVPKPGTLHRVPELAQTFRTLAEDGPSAFYTGKIAEQIVAEIKAGGGVLDMEDLAAYRARWRQPSRAKLRSHELVTAPLPSAGGFIVIKTLQLLQEAGALELRRDDPQAQVQLARAFRLAFWLRRIIACDPDYIDDRQAKLIEEIWSKHGSLDELEKDMHDQAVQDPLPRNGSNRSTTHFCVLDQDGNAVSNTYSLNTLFGNKLAVRGGGFLLNNSMDDFSMTENYSNWYQLIEGKENLLRPGRRPVTSMTPTLLTHGKNVRLLIGGAGGPRIPTMIVQILLSAENLNLPAAMQVPRIHHQYVPDRVNYESGTSEEVLTALKAAGFKVSERPQRAIGIGAGIKWVADNDELSACLDPRFVALI
jgi:gamma-glutamyltranspeptidase/glutathione hydrolase